MKDPGPQELKLISQEIEQLRRDWVTFRGYAKANLPGGRGKLQNLQRSLGALSGVVRACLEGRAPYILHERNIDRRRRESFRKGGR